MTQLSEMSVFYAPAQQLVGWANWISLHRRGLWDWGVVTECKWVAIGGRDRSIRRGEWSYQGCGHFGGHLLGGL